MKKNRIHRVLIIMALLFCLFPIPLFAQCYGDFDCSGTVDGVDLAIFAEHYGGTSCATWLGQIVGTVQCQAGGPIAGAMVYVPGDSFISITDDLGRFKLRALPDGTYTIVVRLSDDEIGREEDVQVLSDTVTTLSIDATNCAAEICDGIDNDYDGLVDEDLVAEPCPLQVGVCAGALKTCGGADGWLPCDVSTYSNFSSDYEVEEISCDNLDNNCNGIVDGMEQTCGFNDIGLCILGTQTCTGGNWGSCEGAVWPEEEICGDELDNNCDGRVDENCPPG